jgi:DNA modification methylase
MILIGDVREKLAEIGSASVQTCITSPPYWGLRDYGNDNQIGLEKSPEEYVAQMVKVFREVKRVLRDDGTLWLNLGDSYFPHNGSRGNKESFGGDSLRGRENDYQPAPKLSGGELLLKQKDLVGIPWMLAFALRADGWYLRQDIIWAKPNPMPESVKDRCTKSHEYLFLLTKSARYYFSNDAIKEPSMNLGITKIRFGGGKYGDSNDPKHATKSGNKYVDSGLRNKRDVWTINTKPFKGAHFAVMPEALVEPCILAGSKVGDIVLDPFAGSGTVGVVALRHNRDFVGVEINPEYAELARQRINDTDLYLPSEKGKKIRAALLPTVTGEGGTDEQADSNRYKQMGNAVAVPVVEWIIKRIIANA